MATRRCSQVPAGVEAGMYRYNSKSVWGRGLSNPFRTLHIACALSQSANIPGLDAVVKAGLKLAEMVQETREVQDQCSLLAERAAKYSAAVYCQLTSGTFTLDGVTATRYIDDLIHTLSAIEALMIRRKNAGFVRAFWYRTKAAKEVKTLNGQLDDAFRVFDIQSSIHANQQILTLLQCTEHLLQHAENAEHTQAALLYGNRRIHAGVKEILQRVRVDATHDGTLRLYGREDLELVEELETENTGVMPGEQPVTRFRARICETGREVTVRRFPRPGRKFRDAIDTVKKIWHPNVVHAIGYSREDPEIAFIVNSGVYTHTFNELGKTFHGIDKLLWTVNSTKQILAGLMYLKSVYEELEWPPDEDTQFIQAEKQVVVGADGRVLLDVSCYDLKQLPNTVSHDEGMVELHKAREVVKGFSNPLDGPCEARFAALCDLWQKLASFADFEREDSLIWPCFPIVCPGQCFSLENRMLIEGLEYESLVYGQSLEPTYREPSLHLHPELVKQRLEREGMLDASDRPLLRHDVVMQEMVGFGTDGEEITVNQPWRRYSVGNMNSGWTLETITSVREKADCRGWFMNYAVDLCHTEEDLDNLAIACALRFRTRTYLVAAPGERHKALPPTLFFYERVHTEARTSLDSSLDWPMGFWSRDPNDEMEPVDPTDVQSAGIRRQRITFRGISPDGEFVWVQQLEHWTFCVKVRVEVEYYRFTPDECLVLHEMQRWATPEDRANSRFELIEDDEVMDCD